MGGWRTSKSNRARQSSLESRIGWKGKGDG